MGLSQKPNELTALVAKSLGLEPSCIRACSTNGSRVSCLVHESWLHEVIAGGFSDGNAAQYVYPGSEYEKQLLLQPSHSGPSLPWIRVCVKVVKKSSAVRGYGLESSSPVGGLEYKDNGNEVTTVAKLLQDISQETHQYCWNTALRSYPLAMSYLPNTDWGQTDEQDIVAAIIKNVFGLPKIPLQKTEHDPEKLTSFEEIRHSEDEGNRFDLNTPKNSNIIPLVCAFESDTAYFLMEPFFPYGLHDIFVFSPAVMSHSTIRLLFVIYQLLHSLRWYHEHNLPFGNLTLDNVRVSKGLFIYLNTPSMTEVLQIPNFTCPSTEDTEIGNSIVDCQLENNQEIEQCDTVHANKGAVTFRAMSSTSNGPSSQEAHLGNVLSNTDILNHDLVTLVDMWVRNEITNFDYLMALNYFSGRRLGDPNHHPLFPWVTDFTAEHGEFRDLSKSKFRLNKGDHHLDLTYKQSWLESHEAGNADTVPHHVSDVLSEITYHAYLARRTPVSVLCKHLRSNWVPNEYPASMQRLYEWTPDECIPQFFTDPSIFTSIHPDLPDLALPSWTSVAEEFISWHREVLESDEVSKHLHHWIDITFGNKLSGRAAIKAKNVCLDLVSKRQSASNYGVVQLFTQPHPPQSSCATLLDSSPLRYAPLCRQTAHTSVIPDQGALLSQLKARLDDSMMSLDSIDDGSHESDVIHTKRDNDPEPQTSNPLVNTLAALMSPKENVAADNEGRFAEEDMILLPDEFKPLELLEKYEAIQQFKRQLPANRRDVKTPSKPRLLTREALLKSLMQKDMESLGCLLVEIVLTDKVRLVTAGLTSEQKAQAIRDMVAANPKILPRFVRNGVLSLLKQKTRYQSLEDRGATNKDSDDENDHESLPPLSAGLLLHPQTGLFPFPEYFQEIHSIIVKFHQERLTTGNSQEMLDTPGNTNIEGLKHCYTHESSYSTSQVDISLECLPSLLPKLDDEGFQLLLYHLEPLFTSQETCLYAFTHLFDLLAHAMGPKLTAKTFMKPLIQLCDSRSLENYEHLVSQGFLSQIIVRFGLENFLTNFASFVIDAVAFELMLQKTSQTADRSSIHSTEELMVDESDVQKEKKSKRAMYLSVDEEEDLINDSSPNFSDQEETDNYTVHVDDVDDDVSDYVSRSTKEHGINEPFIGQHDADSGIFKTEEQDGVLHQLPSSETSYKEDVNIKRQADISGIRFEQKSGLEPQKDQPNGLPSDDNDAIVTTKHTMIETEVEECKNSTNQVSDTSGKGLEEDAIVREDYITSKAGADISKTQEGHDDDNKAPPLKFEEDLTMEEDESSSGSQSEDEASENNNGGINGDSNEDLDSDGPAAYGFYQDTSVVHPPEENEMDRAADLTPSYVSGIAAESVMWLAPRLGPVLTSKYLAQQLLQMLPQCYIDVLGAEEYELEDEDRKAKWVLYCLGSFCILYGEAFVLHQYLPYVQKIINTFQSRFSARGEASLAAVFALLKYCIPYISKDTLVQNFESLLKTSFQPVLRILSSWNTKFPGGGEARAALCHSYVDLLTSLSMKLERELARELMTAPLQQFFSCFELVHLKKKEYKLGNTSFTAVTSNISFGNVESTAGVSTIPTGNESFTAVSSTISQGNGESTTGRSTVPSGNASFTTVPSTIPPENGESTVVTTQGNGESTMVSSAIQGNGDSPAEVVQRVKIPAEHEGDITRPDQIEAFYRTAMYEELCQTFSPAMAHHAYVPLCGIMGSKYMETALYNHDLIWSLCCSHDAQLSHPHCDDAEDDVIGEAQRMETGGESEADGGEGTGNKGGSKAEAKKSGKGGSLRRRGSKPRIPSWLRRTEKNKEPDTSSIGKPEASSSSDQYLRGSWLDHWKHQLHSKTSRDRGSQFNLQQMKLQTFTGHSGPVRSIYIQDSEHFFLSASKDKTVKLWSLSNHGGGTAQSASSCTYYRHTRGVFAVDMVESVRQAASCDGTVHIWDPVSTSTLNILELPRGNSVVAMAAMPAPSQSVVVATSESTARFIDVRQCRFVQEWKTTTSGVAGSVRDICCSPDGRWVALGFTSGLVSVLDVRGGLLRSQRRAHTSDILQVRAFNANSLVTSSVDQGLSMWKDDGLRLKSLKGHVDPLHLLIVLKDDVISASTANRIGLHVTHDEFDEVQYTSYKLPPDVFRGNITSMGYLPLNRLLLLGSDTGNITLCA